MAVPFSFFLFFYKKVEQDSPLKINNIRKLYSVNQKLHPIEYPVRTDPGVGGSHSLSLLAQRPPSNKKSD